MDKKIKVLIVYASKDEAGRDMVAEHLQILTRQNYVNKIYPKTPTGSEIKKIWQNHIEDAEIIIPLISASFLNDDFLSELTLEATKRENAKVTPVILRDCIWESTKFGNLDVIPTDDAINNVRNKDKVLKKVSLGVKDVALHIKNPEKEITDSVVFEQKDVKGNYEELLTQFRKEQAKYAQKRRIIRIIEILFCGVALLGIFSQTPKLVRYEIAIILSVIITISAFAFIFARARGIWSKQTKKRWIYASVLLIGFLLITGGYYYQQINQHTLWYEPTEQQIIIGNEYTPVAEKHLEKTFGGESLGNVDAYLLADFAGERHFVWTKESIQYAENKLFAILILLNSLAVFTIFVSLELAAQELYLKDIDPETALTAESKARSHKKR